MSTGDAIDLEVLPDGRIMLIPVEPVPKHQMWAWTTESKEAIACLRKGPTLVLVSLHVQHDKAYRK